MANASRRHRRQHLALLAKFLSDSEGRRYFYDLLASAHVFTTSFGTNALAMAFNEGERNLGLRLLGDIEEASPDALILMFKEANDERRNNTTGTDRDSDTGADPFADAGTNSDA